MVAVVVSDQEGRSCDAALEGAEVSIEVARLTELPRGNQEDDDEDQRPWGRRHRVVFRHRQQRVFRHRQQQVFRHRQQRETFEWCNYAEQGQRRRG